MRASASKRPIGAVLLLCLLLAACAAPSVPRPDFLLADAQFGPATERINADDVLALSDAMRAYAQTEIVRRRHMRGRNGALFDALYGQNQLKLDYDAATTRNAAQAFAARSGNCLSLVIMTAAFAKELGLQFQYQVAIDEVAWSRVGDLYLRNGHVNLMLGNDLRLRDSAFYEPEFVIDFLPPQEIRGLRTRRIGERTVIAMFMNNRAAEALVDGRIDDAYWWARAAIDSDAGFLNTYNTLGVVYQRHGKTQHAERAFRYVLAREPANAAALANLAALERRQGNLTAAGAFERELAQVEGRPPFYFFSLAQQAMERGDYRAARDLLAKEMDRDPYYHEFHFMLAVAEYRLGDVKRAQKELALAQKNSATRADRDLYAAKLAWLREHR